MNHRILSGAVLAITAMACTTVPAATVEVNFDITAKTRLLSTSGQSTYDTTFQPQTFSMVVRFELEAFREELYLYEWYSPQALTVINQASSTATPYSASLQAPAPAGAIIDDGYTGIELLRTLSGWHYDADQTLPATEHFFFTTSESAWRTPVQDGVFSEHNYWRGIEWVRDIAPTSRNQLTKIPVEDILSFLQGQVGSTIAGAYSEDGWDTVWNDWRGSYRQQAGQSIRGDVFIRSVSVVPEPGTMALCASGMVLLAWHRLARRQQG